MITAADRKPLYTIERLAFDGGTVAHFAVRVHGEFATIAANAVPQWPLIGSSERRGTRGGLQRQGCKPDVAGCASHT